MTTSNNFPIFIAIPPEKATPEFPIKGVENLRRQALFPVEIRQFQPDFAEGWGKLLNPAA